MRGMASNNRPHSMHRKRLPISIPKQFTSCFVPCRGHRRHIYNLYPDNYSTINIPTTFRSSFYSTSSSLFMSSSLPNNINWESITNHKTSKTVKLFKSVHRANKSKRSELGLTVAEGVRLVTDILSNEDSRRLVRKLIISESLLYNDGAADEYQQKLYHWLQILDEETRMQVDSTTTTSNCSINIGTDQVVDACSGTVTTQGVIALIEIPPQYNPQDDANENIDNTNNMPPFYVILDGLSDPGNVGTLLRSCAASHVTALLLLHGSCDVWNPKAVRSAMGASFRVPVLEMSRANDNDDSLDSVLGLLNRCGVEDDRIYAATMEASGGDDDNRASMAHYNIDFADKGGAAIILGKEGEGLRSNVIAAIKQGRISTVHVPMVAGTESLNAAVCGSIIMFERMRQMANSESINMSS